MDQPCGQWKPHSNHTQTQHRAEDDRCQCLEWARYAPAMHSVHSARLAAVASSNNRGLPGTISVSSHGYCIAPGALAVGTQSPDPSAVGAYRAKLGRLTLAASGLGFLGPRVPPMPAVPLRVRSETTPASASCQEEQQTFLRLTGAKSAAKQPPDERGVAQARRTLRLSPGRTLRRPRVSSSEGVAAVPQNALCRPGERGVVPPLSSVRFGFGPGSRLGCNPHPIGERNTMWKQSGAGSHPPPLLRNLRHQAPLGASPPPARAQGCLTL